MEKKFQFFRKLLLLTLLMLGVGSAFGAWDGTSMTEPSTEKIDGKDYYIIDSEAKLAWFTNESNRKHTTSTFNKNAKLTADLDMGSHLWVPICAGTGGSKDGKTYCRYKGIFDGDGHKITNVYIKAEELSAIDKNYAQNLGFVGVHEGTIKNLILENVDIQASTNAGDVIQAQDKQISVGSVVGWIADNGGNVENCMASGTIKTTGNKQGVGGIVGNAKKGSITNCLSLVEIQASGSEACIGGIIGITKVDVSVSSCVYAGPGLVNTGSGGATGGITGNVYSGNMTAVNSYYEGTNYYQGNVVGGVGKGCSNPETCQDNTTKVEESNKDFVACALNGMEGEGDEAHCKTEPWSVGETSLSLNGYGTDGYKIVFSANEGVFDDGSEAKNKFLDAGMVITADEIGNPSRDFYTFIGWAFTQDATEPENLGTVSKSDTVYAVWEAKIKVTFDANGGSFPTENTQEIVKAKDVYVSKGSPITVDGLGSLPVSYCKEYSETNTSQCVLTMYFTGWKDDVGNTVDFNNHDVIATSNVTYKAIWTDVRTYSVTFHANNNTTVDIVVYVDNGETVTTRPTAPTKDGYVFSGWYDGDELFDFESQIDTSKDLYAHWTPNQYHVYYVLNDGGASKGDNPESFTLGEGLLALNPAIAQDGYVFEGWFYDADFKQKASSIDRDVVGDKTFYAQWSKKTYRIVYMAVNGVYGGASDQIKEHGTSINLLPSGFFTFPGYEQDGWSTTSDGETEFQLGQSYENDAPLTLYPTKGEAATYTITYVCEGCENDSRNPKTYKMNETKNLKNPLSVPEGYSFGGWFVDQAYTPKAVQQIKQTYGNLTLYGKLNVKYKLTYVLNGSTDDYNRDYYTVDDGFTLNAPAPREGYTFAGWYDNAEFTGEPVTSVPKGSTGDKTFYAKWVKNNNGAITFTKQSDGTFSAVINGNYGGDDTPNSDEADAVVITSDVTVSSVTLNRSFNVNRISTLYVPFEIDAANVTNATVYKFKNVVWNENEKRWIFKVAQTTKVLANTPYVVLPSASQVTFDFSGTVTFNTTTPGEHAVSKDGYWEFKGLYEYTKFIMDNKNPIFVFANQERSGAKLGEFVRTTQGAYSNPMRAYLVYHQDNSLSKSARGSLGGRILLPDELDIVVEDENGIVVETGLLNMVTGEVKMDRWFDLKGRMLNSKPSAKGTYYKNGKKVIIK